MLGATRSTLWGSRERPRIAAARAPGAAAIRMREEARECAGPRGAGRAPHRATAAGGKTGRRTVRAPSRARAGSNNQKVNRMKQQSYDYDYVVVGSGFGGSVSALRLSEKGYRVLVIEQGRRWTPENLPESTWNLSRWQWRPALGLRGFFSMRFFRHVVVLHGNAVGGGSITYANTLLVPPDKVWREGTWAGLEDWERVMPAHYATAKRMLGAVTNRRMDAADFRLKDMAKLIGVEKSFYPTEVGVFFGDDADAPGTRYADPYFGGAGPERTSCIGCGGCMVGCRHGAKNTLDRNYLYLAERLGAQVREQTKVVDVRPLDARADGAAGYAVEAVSLAAGARGAKSRLTCRGVVFAASSLGTQDLLMRLKEKGSLPRLSDALGKRVRTNAESLIGVRFPKSRVDLSKGVAIGSGIYIDEHTHIEATRYPSGSDTMGLLTTVLTRGAPGGLRVLVWLGALAKLVLTRPLSAWRMIDPRGFARETMIFLCMQTLEGHLTMRLKRRWFWPFSKQLATSGAKIPAYIPAANDFAQKAARALGGVPMTSLTEILLNVPMTAHCMGGAAMARDARDGVCDGRSRVFGYRNMYVCDGSVLGANLGVNPSLTITALAEHAMSHVPAAREQRWDSTAETPVAA
ncbi:cholesterol oxidase [Burkholderia pseudomallei]|uniref:GMC oxidoreductase n=1 Tax=Burkholderia pseudomallei TaxID=28450 RepID=UPI0009CD6E81|nr:GMC family oxidoreductase [Burkholderia pseudomallei]ONA12176.1 cholesterol oxidase [Burkholderia pseudomallei]RAQ85373.1 cholesterol oxidase [Burkholderia pseudomallei]